MGIQTFKPIKCCFIVKCLQQCEINKPSWKKSMVFRYISHKVCLSYPLMVVKQCFWNFFKHKSEVDKHKRCDRTNGMENNTSVILDCDSRS